MAKGKNMVLNNRCFTGNFEFQTDNTSSGKYIITSTEKGKAIKIPIKTLTESFESLSDEDMLFYFQESDEVLTIGFSKSKRL